MPNIYRGRLSVVDVLPTPNGVGPNRPHLSFYSEPFGLEQRTLGIASVPQGTKQFIAINGERTCSARQAGANQQQPKYLRDIESVKTEKFKFELDKFIDTIPDQPKM